jgi:heme-degrading monooxygenase HmoA
MLLLFGQTFLLIGGWAMIARIGYFEGLTEDQKKAQEDNSRRFTEAITSQPGIVALFYLERPNGDRLSVSIWESQKALEEGGARANATPLLPGQRREDIPSPNRFEILEVRDHFVAPAPARA